MRLNEYKVVLFPSSIVYHNKRISVKSNNKKINNFHTKSYHSNKNILSIILRYYPIEIIIDIFLMFSKFVKSFYFSLKLKNLRYF